MITWMQRHKKYLIITIWISTIAFIGAGFVGWGQYSYGDKAGAVAKVGNIEISRSELQQSYSNLYNQYNEMFKGNFDEEKAKKFGLQKQALQQLMQQALLLNLASSYDLQISDKEIYNKLKTQKYFLSNGVFDKEVYKRVLSRNNLTMKEYESGLKKELLIQKMLKLFPIKENKNEKKIIDTLLNIADKISYKVLDNSNVKIDTSDKALKKFWADRKNEFMTEITYKLNYIKQNKAEKTFDEKDIQKYYSEHKTHFKAKDGKIISLEKAKQKVLDELNAKATKDMALRTYIAYKKSRLDSNVTISTLTISETDNKFGKETLNKIKHLSITSPYLKPVLQDGQYYIFKLIKINPSRVKTYKEAKNSILPLYIEDTKKEKLLELANSSYKNFKGITTSDFITNKDADKLSGMSQTDANEFLMKLFSKREKNSFIALNSGKIILYNILEQKLLSQKNKNSDNIIVRLKSAMFNEGLIKNLSNKYKTQIFIKGL